MLRGACPEQESRRAQYDKRRVQDDRISNGRLPKCQPAFAILPLLMQLVQTRMRRAAPLMSALTV
jgi:hypothetical protein